MRYTNPSTKSLTWKRAAFFFANDVQHVAISIVKAAGSSTLRSVLDQKRRVGDPYVNLNKVGTANFTSFTSLWHGNVGYVFSNATASHAKLVVSVGTKTGKWNAIGTSQAPPASVNLFSAYLGHKDTTSPLSYTIYPGVDLTQFKAKVAGPRLVILSQGSSSVDAVFDSTAGDLGAVFWVANKQGKLNLFIVIYTFLL